MPYYGYIAGGLANAASVNNSMSFNRDTKPWWRRCVSAALLNGIIWLTPPPIHFIALFLPFFSGYSIASGRRVKGLWAASQISFLMGLTLGSTILGIGIVAIAAISWLEHRVNLVYVAVVIGVSLGIGSYTGFAAFFGALWAAYRRNCSEGEDGNRG